MAILIDENVKEIGHGCNVSGWISNACEAKLKVRYGLTYKYKYKKIENELAE